MNPLPFAHRPLMARVGFSSLIDLRAISVESSARKRRYHSLYPILRYQSIDLTIAQS
jgi:hypothetical protein